MGGFALNKINTGFYSTDSYPRMLADVPYEGSNVEGLPSLEDDQNCDLNQPLPGSDVGSISNRESNEDSLAHFLQHHEIMMINQCESLSRIDGIQQQSAAIIEQLNQQMMPSGNVNRISSLEQFLHPTRQMFLRMIFTGGSGALSAAIIFGFLFGPISACIAALAGAVSCLFVLFLCNRI